MTNFKDAFKDKQINEGGIWDTIKGTTKVMGITAKGMGNMKKVLDKAKGSGASDEELAIIIKDELGKIAKSVKSSGAPANVIDNFIDGMEASIQDELDKLKG